MASTLRKFLLRWLGLHDHAALIDGLRRDLEQHGRAHSGVLLDAVQQLNSTSHFARESRRVADETAYRLSIYERAVPAMARVKAAKDAQVKRNAKKAAAASALAAPQSTYTTDTAEPAEMAVTEGDVEAVPDAG